MAQGSILPRCSISGHSVFCWGRGKSAAETLSTREAFGTNTTLPWGVAAAEAPRYHLSKRAGMAAQGVAVDPSVHPTFLTHESI